MDKNFEPSDSKGFISPEEIVSPTSAKDIPPTLQSKMLPFLPLSHCLLDQKRLSLKELPGKTILMSPRPDLRLSKLLEGEIKGVVHEEVMLHH